MHCFTFSLLLFIDTRVTNLSCADNVYRYEVLLCSAPDFAYCCGIGKLRNRETGPAKGENIPSRSNEHNQRGQVTVRVTTETTQKRRDSTDLVVEVKLRVTIANLGVSKAVALRVTRKWF